MCVCVNKGEGRGGSDKLINMSSVCVKRLQACRPVSNRDPLAKTGTERERMCFYSNIHSDLPPIATVVYLEPG